MRPYSSSVALAKTESGRYITHCLGTLLGVCFPSQSPILTTTHFLVRFTTVVLFSPRQDGQVFRPCCGSAERRSGSGVSSWPPRISHSLHKHHSSRKQRRKSALCDPRPILCAPRPGNLTDPFLAHFRPAVLSPSTMTLRTLSRHAPTSRSLTLLHLPMVLSIFPSFRRAPKSHSTAQLYVF